jgi:hypothetical protein
MGNYNHRREENSNLKKLDLDCYRLAQVFPFTYNHGTLRTGDGKSISILPTKASNDTPMSEISIKERNAWANLPEKFGRNLTRAWCHI